MRIISAYALDLAATPIAVPPGGPADTAAYDAPGQLAVRGRGLHGSDVTVVFEQPPSPPISSTVIEVAHAPRPRADSADDEIVRRLLGEAEPGEVRVVTSDRWLADRALAAGASVQPANSFRRELED